VKCVASISAALVAGFSLSVSAQNYSEPSRSYLHEIVQSWTEKSTVGNLRAAAFPDDDIEVRIWAGFGLGGTYGGVLRRSNGSWTISHLWLNRYIAGATDEIAVRDGLLAPSVVEEMESRSETVERIPKLALPRFLLASIGQTERRRAPQKMSFDSRPRSSLNAGTSFVAADSGRIAKLTN